MGNGTPTTKEYRQWLRTKLREHDIDREYLIGLAIVVERIIYEESLRINRYTLIKPYYPLRLNGKRTRAWLHLAELALFCRHRGYNPAEYVKTLCNNRRIRGMLYWQRKQLPLNLISPSTRLNSAQLRKNEDFYLRQRNAYTLAYKTG